MAARSQQYCVNKALITPALAKIPNAQLPTVEMDSKILQGMGTLGEIDFASLYEAPPKHVTPTVTKHTATLQALQLGMKGSHGE